MEALTLEQQVVERAGASVDSNRVVVSENLAKGAVIMASVYLEGGRKPIPFERAKEVLKPLGNHALILHNLERAGFLTCDGAHGTSRSRIVCVDKSVFAKVSGTLTQFWPVPASEDPQDAPSTPVTAEPVLEPVLVSAMALELHRRLYAHYGRTEFLDGDGHRAVASDWRVPTYYDRLRQLTEAGAAEEVPVEKGPRKHRMTGGSATARDGTTYAPVESAPVAAPAQSGGEPTAAPSAAEAVVAPSGQPAKPFERLLVLRRVPVPSPAEPVAQVEPVVAAPAEPKPAPRTIRSKESIEEAIREIESRAETRNAWERELAALMERKPAGPSVDDPERLLRLRGAYLYYDDIVVPDTAQG